jgi:RNA polymerase sigma-70 factor (sigma-E family)
VKVVDDGPDAGARAGSRTVVEPEVGEVGHAGEAEDHPADGFVRLYQGHYAELVRLAFVLVDSNEQAEELVQDAFARAYLRWDKIETPLAYVRRVVVNACHDVLRRRRIERRWLARRHDGEAVDGEPHYLDDALATLPSRERIALVLRYYEGMSEAQMAEAMACPAGTVKSLVHRGTARLREQITP